MLNAISAISDGVVIHTGGSPNQVWASGAIVRPAQEWLQYEWVGEGTLTGAGVSFWHDNESDFAGDGVAVPRAWRLQGWMGGSWQDIQLKDGAAYPRSKTSTNVVEFAQPVTTTRLRALFDATTNGLTFAGVAVSELAVAGAAPQKPGIGAETLASELFNVSINRATGGLYQLGNPKDAPFCTNYVANPTLRPQFDVNDSRWTGDVGLRVNGTARISGLSDDIRAVTREDDAVEVRYRGDAAHANGIRGFELTERYALGGVSGDVLNWDLRLDNTSPTSMKVEDLTLPMLMNSWWNGGDQKGIYEKNVARHSFVAKDGSYVYWQRPNGEGPYLVMVPKAGTSLEFRDKARTGEGPFGEVDPSWEGLVEFAIHSEQLQPARAGRIGGYLPATSLTLAPGASKTYGFTFRWANDYAHLRDVLYDSGVVDVVSLPGMVIPKDQKATLAVRAKDGIDSIVGEAGKDVTVTAAGSRNGYSLYEVTFSKLGPSKVTVRYGAGRESVLQYNSIAPIEQLIASRADFLTKKQQVRGTSYGYEGAFLQWDMSRERLTTWHNYPGGGWKQWMAGGSDDLGLSPAAFLSELNVQTPSQEQIAALDYYIEEFIWGYMQTQTDGSGNRTYRVYHWYDGTDGSAPGTADGLATWRVMNYPHVWNTYFNMYRIAKAYPDVDTALTADQYLMRAYNTMRAYFQHPNVGTLDDASRHLGSMGEMTMPEIVASLEDENHQQQADELEGFIAAKGHEMLSREYPFASEMSIDTTAFEAVYTLAKRYGDDAMARKVTQASLAARGLQPLWYYYGSDNRHMGESWWNLGYETQLGAWQQQDYLLNYDAAADGVDPDEAMRSTYGAYLAGWSNINAGQISGAAANIGAASWQYQSQLGAGEGQWGFMPMLNGWWAWSGEADLGFWGGLRTAAVNVVNDDVVGLYAYGGEVELTDGTYTVTPKDGVRNRLSIFPTNKFTMQLEQAKYTTARVSEDLKDITVNLQGGVGGVHTSTIKLTNVPAGSYHVAVDGQRMADDVTVNQGTAMVRLPSLAESSIVRIWQDDTAPTVTITAPTRVTAEGASGAIVTYTATATDIVDGSVTPECSPTSGTIFPIGDSTIACTARDTAGNTRTTTSKVTVAYNWTGFFAPIDNTDTASNPVFNKIRAGSTVRVRFALGGNMGLNVLDGPISSRAVSCTTGTAMNDVVLPTSSSGGLTYQASSGEYQYYWVTDKTFAGCRELTVKLMDGTRHSAYFNFGK